MTPHEIFKQKMGEFDDKFTRTANENKGGPAVFAPDSYVAEKLRDHQKSLALALLKGVEEWAYHHTLIHVEKSMYGNGSFATNSTEKREGYNQALSELKAFLTAECEMINKTN